MGVYPFNDYRYYLQHSAKDTTWHKEDHKYLYKKDGRYYYEELKGKAEELKRKAKEFVTPHMDIDDEYEYRAIQNLSKSSSAITPEKVEKEKARLMEEDRLKEEKAKKKEANKEKLVSSISSLSRRMKIKM